MTASPLGVAGFYLLVAAATTVVVVVAAVLLVRDGTLAPRVSYVSLGARATTVFTRSMLDASAAALDRRQSKRADTGARRRADDRPAAQADSRDARDAAPNAQERWR